MSKPVFQLLGCPESLEPAERWDSHYVARAQHVAYKCTLGFKREYTRAHPARHEWVEVSYISWALYAASCHGNYRVRHENLYVPMIDT
jgi:hypothetical protein